MDPKKIIQLKEELLKKLALINDETSLEQFRLDFMSRQGKLAKLFDSLKTATVDEKRLIGPALNELKNELQSSFLQKQTTLEQQKIQNEHALQKNFDVTVNKPRLHGSLHPYTHVITQIEAIFTSMGYQVVDGP
ncbi:hypothetical protein KAZ82_00960, partial [Candidatus Babeliales bacterium]|nr:hypothetical protein [Candidatus Babeliales bacterium]